MRTNTRKFRLALTALTLVALVLVTVPVSLSAGPSVITVRQPSIFRVQVPGTACPFFAGQTLSGLQTTHPPTAPPGSCANFHNDTADVAMMPPSIEVCGGGTLTIAAIGTWAYGPTAPLHGPDGATWYPLDFWSHAEYDDLGISRVQGYPGNLVGVFLGDGAPSLPAPSPLSQYLGHDMTTPELQQAFIIGDILANITIPVGATRLFFGYFDGYEWNNNRGSVVVTMAMSCPPVIEKMLLEGPGEIGIYLPGPTEYVFEITYSGPAAKVIDTVPAEFEIVGLAASAGDATSFRTGGGGTKGANRIVWDVPAGSNTLEVTIHTVQSPGGGHKATVFKPTSCGPLPLNDGAIAYEVDPLTGEIVKVWNPDTELFEPVVIVGPSNALEVEAVEGVKPCEEG